MKIIFPPDIYTKIMILRWKLMREDLYKKQLPDAINREYTAMNEYIFLSTRRHKREYKIKLRNASVKKFNHDFNINTSRLENFWLGQRKKRDRNRKREIIVDRDEILLLDEITYK